MPASAEAMKSSGTFPVPRNAVPAVIMSMQTRSVRSMPTRRPSQEAGMANRPRQTIGKVVRALAAASERPVEATMSGSTTERLENTGRRLNAIRMTDRPRRNWRFRVRTPGVGVAGARLSVWETAGVTRERIGQAGTFLFREADGVTKKNGNRMLTSPACRHVLRVSPKAE